MCVPSVSHMTAHDAARKAGTGDVRGSGPVLLSLGLPAGAVVAEGDGGDDAGGGVGRPYRLDVGHVAVVRDVRRVAGGTVRGWAVPPCGVWGSTTPGGVGSQNEDDIAVTYTCAGRYR